MTLTTISIHSIDEHFEPDSEDAPSDEEGDRPKPCRLDTHRCGSASTLPNGVWFGPKGSEATEKELVAFLGSHNGVAVLQWPRDTHRSNRFFALGIPCLWIVQDTDDVPPIRDKYEEWLPRTTSDLQIHESLRRLCDWAAAERSAVLPRLEQNGWLHLGDHGIQLTPPESRLAAPLVARFGEPVDDEFLTRKSLRSTARPKNSLAGELDHLDRDVNTLGLEVVRATEYRHLIRRCR